MKHSTYSYFVITMLILAPTLSIAEVAQADDDSIFQQEDFVFNDYKDETPAANTHSFGFEKKASRNETIAITEKVEPASVTISLGGDGDVEELPNKELKTRTKVGFANANRALPADDHKLSVNLRRK